MSVINQMLKDLEQRRAQGFNNRHGILGDLAAAGSPSGRDRILKLILLLLVIALIILAWLLWERFTQLPPHVALMSNPVDQPVAVQLRENEPPKKTVEKTSEAAVVETNPVQHEQIENKPEAAAEEVAKSEPVIEPAISAGQLLEEDNKEIVSSKISHIERIEPNPLIATGERTLMRVYGEGFIQPLEVVLEWSDGKAFSVLDKQQVELISENEMHVHFNPGMQPDQWTIHVEHAGVSSVRFPFSIEADPTRSEKPVSVSAPVAKPQSIPAKTRLTRNPADEAASLFAKASAWLKKGQAGKAEKTLQELLVLDARQSRARELLASLLYQDRRYAEAADILMIGMSQQPGHIPFKLLLARVYMEQGRDNDAISVLESGAPQAREHSDYYALLAALYQRAGSYAKAAKVYRGLLSVFPGHAVWWMGLGISLQSLNEKEEALTAYQRALNAPGLQPELKKFVQKRIRLLGG